MKKNRVDVQVMLPLVRRLTRLIHRHGYSLASIGRALGLNRNKFGMSRCHSLNLNDIVLILEFLGEPLEAFFLPNDRSSIDVPEPVRLLRRFRLVAEPESPELRRWLRFAPSLEKAFPSADLPKEADEINALRLNDLSAAQRYAERWVNDTWRKANQANAGARSVQDYILALGSWASVMRTVGKINDSAIALEQALLLQSAKPLGLPWASLLVKVGFVLRDLASRRGATSVLPVLHQAAGQIYLFLGPHSKHMLAVQSTIADLSLYSRQWEVSERAARKALDVATAPIDRYYQYYHLALLYSFLQDSGQAWSSLESALQEVSLNELPKHPRFLNRWLTARLVAARGDLESARTIFMNELIPFSDTQPLKRLLVFCDLALILQRLNDLETFAQVARRFSKELPHLPVSWTAMAIAKDFLVLCEDSIPSRRRIEETRRQLDDLA